MNEDAIITVPGGHKLNPMQCEVSAVHLDGMIWFHVQGERRWHRLEDRDVIEKIFGAGIKAFVARHELEEAHVSDGGYSALADGAL